MVSEWGLCTIGHLAAVSILSLYLLTTLELPPGLAAGLLLFAALSYRIGRFLVAPLLDRMPARSALMLCLSAGAAGYLVLGALPYTTATFAAAVLLVGAGFGGNTLRVYALASGREEGRLYRYSALNVATNVAAAIGPLFGTWLFLHLGPRSPFALAAAAFVAAMVLLLRVPGEDLEQAARSQGFIRALGTCLASPVVRQSIVVRTLLFVMTSQLYAVFPLAATRMLDAAALLGIYFTVNAVLVSLGQIPVTRLAVALAASPRLLITAGFASYSLGFLSLFLWPNRLVAFAMVACCSLAEMLIPPPTDSLVGSALPDSLRVAGFTLNMLAAALGEAVGIFSGVWAAGQLIPVGRLSLWYGVLALASFGSVIVTAVMVHRPRRASVVID